VVPQLVRPLPRGVHGSQKKGSWVKVALMAVEHRRPRGQMRGQGTADWNSGIEEKIYAKSKVWMHLGTLPTFTEYL
jgi:hypothetical protein